jgi:hypothetical protein
MNPAGRQQVMERKSPAVAYFYTATERRSRGVMWPSITPALTTIEYKLLKVELEAIWVFDQETGKVYTKGMKLSANFPTDPYKAIHH